YPVSGHPKMAIRACGRKPGLRKRQGDVRVLSWGPPVGRATRVEVRSQFSSSKTRTGLSIQGCLRIMGGRVRCLRHSRNDRRTVEALGYPNLETLILWLNEAIVGRRNPHTAKRNPKGAPDGTEASRRGLSFFTPPAA